MTRTLVVAAVIAGVCASSHANAQTGSFNVAQAVAKVDAFYAQTQTFSAEFSQEYFARAYHTTKTSTGHVTFAKPGMMNWVYAPPSNNRLVSNGSTLTVTAPGAPTYQQQVSMTQYPTAFAFLTGQGTLASSFTFTFNPALNFPGGFVLIGTPLTPTAGITQVLFYVDANTSQIRRVLTLDGQQNRNRLDFINPQVNVAVNPATFTVANAQTITPMSTGTSATGSASSQPAQSSTSHP